MAKKTAPLLPSTDALLRQLGERLRVARLRRRLAAKQVAERAGMAPMTLRSVERGGSGVTMGAYLAVMQVLGVEKDLNLLAKADPLGRELQDARLPAPTRRPVTNAPAVLLHEAREPAGRPIEGGRKQLEPTRAAADWIEESGFASSESLASLIKPRSPTKRG